MTERRESVEGKERKGEESEARRQRLPLSQSLDERNRQKMQSRRRETEERKRGKKKEGMDDVSRALKLMKG